MSSSLILQREDADMTDRGEHCLFSTGVKTQVLTRFDEPASSGLYKGRTKGCLI